MANPPIKATLESTELTNLSEPTRRRLQQCLASDTSNIRPGAPGGDHVKAIQQALRKLRLRIPDLKLPEIKDKDGEYGIDTTAAVLRYKSERHIVREGQPLDPIVGRMTLTALDNDLLDPSPPVVISQDVLVHILGARVGIPIEGEEETEGQPQIQVASVINFNNTINTPEYLERHKPILHKQFHGGQGLKSPVNKIVKFISESHDPNGFVIVIGLSSGGPAVVEVAQGLLARKSPIRLALAAIVDGSFDNKNDKRLTAVMGALKSLNLFQSRSNFAGQEFHGAVQFCQSNRDFADDTEFREEQRLFDIELNKVPPLFPFGSRIKGGIIQAFINKLHVMALRKGYPLAKSEALMLLRP